VTLRFNGAWRFTPPPDGQYRNRAIPDEAVREFYGMIRKISTQGDRQPILEHFKGAFCGVAGSTHVWSSNASWAETDLYTYMDQASQNAPLFLEAFFDACQTLSSLDQNYYGPNAAMINELSQKHRIGYEIRPPDLILRHSEIPVVSVTERPATLAEEAMNLLQNSLQRADELLREGRGREAVQETLWLLESVTTAFRGIESLSEVIRGTYFNHIVQDLRRLHRGAALDRILNWMMALHGYLSSPTGGGIRHGLDLNEGVTIELNEARLYCNLVRSYLSYLLVEHERLSASSHKYVSG
jgi:hypothetical protein